MCPNRDPEDLPEFSVVVPFYDEVLNVGPLLLEIEAALPDRHYEIVAVDDGSTDGTDLQLERLALHHPRLRVLHHRRRRGQSAAIRSGVLSARAPLIATLDGDGQNPPDQLPLLLEALLRGPAELGLVAGQRRKRQDSLGKRVSSRIANAVRRTLLRDGALDTGCGLKVFRRDAYLRLPYFDRNHRFMPALMRREGYDVGHVAVEHRPRRAGRSKYGNLQRAAVGLVDLLGVMWLNSRASGAGSEMR